MSETTRIEALKASLLIAEKLDLRETGRIVDNAKLFDKFLSGVQDAESVKPRRGRPPGKVKDSG